MMPTPIRAKTRLTLSQDDLPTFKVMPGEMHIGTQPEMITTTLGSCIAVICWDPALQIGGLNHFMLPCSSSHQQDGPRYGAYAMEMLINGLIHLGSSKRRLQLKCFGAAQISGFGPSVSSSNINFIRRYIANERLQLVGEDLGGQQPRQVKFNPYSGKAWVKSLPTTQSNQLSRRERRYLDDVDSELDHSNVELF